MAFPSRLHARRARPPIVYASCITNSKRRASLRYAAVWEAMGRCDFRCCMATRGPGPRAIFAPGSGLARTRAVSARRFKSWRVEPIMHMRRRLGLPGASQQQFPGQTGRQLFGLLPKPLGFLDKPFLKSLDVHGATLCHEAAPWINRVGDASLRSSPMVSHGFAMTRRCKASQPPGAIANILRARQKQSRFLDRPRSGVTT
jgi:hypothetical protein